jgi:hypothetical protein
MNMESNQILIILLFIFIGTLNKLYCIQNISDEIPMLKWIILLLIIIIMKNNLIYLYIFLTSFQVMTMFDYVIKPTSSSDQ